MEQYDEEYFERGKQSGKSCYENYHWMPEATIRAAHYVIQYLGLRCGDTVLDYGCAKGYLVKALRMLGVEAYGCDVSKYAIDEAPDDIRRWLSWLSCSEDPTPFWRAYQWVISKDVMEHMTEEQLDVFHQRTKHCPNFFHVIPLADETTGKYIMEENEKDVTHVLRRNYEWWINRFVGYNLRIKSFTFDMVGLKEPWTLKYPQGHGFFILERR